MAQKHRSRSPCESCCCVPRTSARCKCDPADRTSGRKCREITKTCGQWSRSGPVPPARGGLGGFCSPWGSLVFPGRTGTVTSPSQTPSAFTPLWDVLCHTLCTDRQQSPVLSRGAGGASRAVSRGTAGPGEGTLGLSPPRAPAEPCPYIMGAAGLCPADSSSSPQRMPVLPIGNSAPRFGGSWCCGMRWGSGGPHTALLLQTGCADQGNGNVLWLMPLVTDDNPVTKGWRSCSCLPRIFFLPVSPPAVGRHQLLQS